VLYVLIPIAWLAVASLVVAACRAAASADAAAIVSEPAVRAPLQGTPVAPLQGTPVVLFRGLTLFEDRQPGELQSLSASLAVTRSRGARRLAPPRRESGALATGSRVRSADQRRARCVTRS
jgi:hypothetical protein